MKRGKHYLPDQHAAVVMCTGDTFRSLTGSATSCLATGCGASHSTSHISSNSPGRNHVLCIDCRPRDVFSDRMLGSNRRRTPRRCVIVSAHCSSSNVRIASGTAIACLLTSSFSIVHHALLHPNGATVTAAHHSGKLKNAWYAWSHKDSVAGMASLVTVTLAIPRWRAAARKSTGQARLA
jgi:hypothetical protein